MLQSTLYKELYTKQFIHYLTTIPEDEYTARLTPEAHALLASRGSPTNSPSWQSSLVLVAIATGNGNFEPQAAVHTASRHGPSTMQGELCQTSGLFRNISTTISFQAHIFLL